MARMMDKEAVAGIIAEMKGGRTNKAAQIALAKAALSRSNLTDCGRTAWNEFLKGL